MPEQYIPVSTTLSDVLARHQRQISNLTRENLALWTAVRLIEAQQTEERAHRRACKLQSEQEPIVPPLYEHNPYGVEPLF